MKKGDLVDVRLAPGIGIVEIWAQGEKHYITDEKVNEHYISEDIEAYSCIKNYYNFSDGLMIDVSDIVEIRQGVGIRILEYAGKRAYLSAEDMEEFFRKT